MFPLPSKKNLAQTLFGTLCLSGLLSSCSEDAQIRSYVIPNQYEGPVVTHTHPMAGGKT